MMAENSGRLQIKQRIILAKYTCVAIIYSVTIATVNNLTRYNAKGQTLGETPRPVPVENPPLAQHRCAETETRPTSAQSRTCIKHGIKYGTLPITHCLPYFGEAREQ